MKNKYVLCMFVVAITTWQTAFPCAMAQPRCSVSLEGEACKRKLDAYKRCGDLSMPTVAKESIMVSQTQTVQLPAAGQSKIIYCTFAQGKKMDVSLINKNNGTLSISSRIPKEGVTSPFVGTWTSLATDLNIGQSKQIMFEPNGTAMINGITINIIK